MRRPEPCEAGQLLFAGFEGPAIPADLSRLVAEGRVGGVVLFRRNFADAAQARALVAELHALAPHATPLVVAVDEEGGRVQRLRDWWTMWPPVRRLGDAGDPALTRAFGRALGLELAELGIDLDLAPVVDVDAGDGDPELAVIGDRSFSGDARVVAEHTRAFVAALQAEGVAACAKHFPGHGGTATDSHRELPRMAAELDDLRSRDLAPFRAAVETGVAAVLVGHLLFPRIDPERPALLSHHLLALLREELGFDGVVLSDDLDMHAVREHGRLAEQVQRALGAGVDVFLVGRDTSARREVLRALESAPPACLAPALARLARLKERYAGGRRSGGAGPPYPSHHALAARIDPHWGPEAFARVVARLRSSGAV